MFTDARIGPGEREPGLVMRPSKCMDVTNPNVDNTTGWSYLTFRKANFQLFLDMGQT